LELLNDTKLHGSRNNDTKTPFRLELLNDTKRHGSRINDTKTGKGVLYNHGPRTWDRRIDYEYAYARLTRLLSSRRVKTKCYSAVLLLQLRNGLRIGEAVDAFTTFVKTGKREFMVFVEKKRRPEERLVVVPPELDDNVRLSCVDVATTDRKVLVNRIKNWVRSALGFNTHSLRYAFITYLLRQGVNPAIIAKITKHSRLDFVLNYTQSKAAEFVLRSL
jgi:integrase